MNKRLSSWASVAIAVLVMGSCSLWPSDYYVVPLRNPMTFSDALSFAREVEIDVTHILFHYDKVNAGAGGVKATNGSDTDVADLEEVMEYWRGEHIRDLEEAKERLGDEWTKEAERQLQDMKDAIYCATGLQAHVHGGDAVRSLKADSRVAAVMKLVPGSVVISGEHPDPEDFADCTGAIRNGR